MKWRARDVHELTEDGVTVWPDRDWHMALLWAGTGIIIVLIICASVLILNQQMETTRRVCLHALVADKPVDTVYNPSAQSCTRR